jgi:hypothetical protein
MRGWSYSYERDWSYSYEEGEAENQAKKHGWVGVIAMRRLEL